MSSLTISLDAIEPNPFRGLGSGYEINDDRVQHLIDSIGRTGFWDNVVVRPHPTKRNTYQQVYGHHRVAAARKAGLTSADFIVRDFDDTRMLKAMADENDTEFGHATGHDVVALHALLDGWADGTIDGYVAPTSDSLRRARSFKAPHGTVIRFTEAQVGEFFGWGSRRLPAAITSLEAILAGDLTIEDVRGLSARKANALTDALREAGQQAAAAGGDVDKAKEVATAAALEAIADDDKAGEAKVKEVARKAVAGTLVTAPAPPPLIPEELVRGIANRVLKVTEEIGTLNALLVAHPEAADFVRGVTGKAGQPAYLAYALGRLDVERITLHDVVVAGADPTPRPLALASSKQGAR
jgi:ParB-like nuclease domain